MGHPSATRRDYVADEIALVPGSSLLVMGMGNIAGVGLELAAAFRNRAEVTIPVQPTHELQKAA